MTDPATACELCGHNPCQCWGWEPDLMTECDHCGRFAGCCRAPDPFEVEGIIEGDRGKSWWCATCFNTRAGDV